MICGFGRTGNWFGSQTMGIRPDIMTLAKGLSSGYAPTGGSMVSDRMAISPPLVISRAEIDLLIDRAVQALDLTHAELQAEGMMKAA